MISPTLDVLAQPEPPTDFGAPQAAERPGIGHEQRSRIGGRWGSAAPTQLRAATQCNGSGKAEVAFAVVDQHQGQGIGAALLHHLAAIARSARLQELIAEVLPNNIPMLKVFEKGGFGLSTKREAGVVHVTLRLF